MVQIGIAGCGWAGKRHGDAAMADDRVAVAAIAERDDELRERFAAEWNVAHAFADVRDMMTVDGLDAIVIALPHDLHKSTTVAAAEGGLDVLCEKPIAMDAAGADEMLDAAQEAGIHLVVAESARYEPRSMVLEGLLADGVVGIPMFAQYDWFHDFGEYGFDDRPWLNDPERTGGGHWLLTGIHRVSVLRGALATAGVGDVETVYASDHRTDDFDAPAGIEGNTTATLRFPGGQTAVLRTALEVPHHDRFNGIRIYGTEGAVLARDHADEIEVYEVESPADEVAGPPEGTANENLTGEQQPTSRVPLPESDAFVRQLSHFVDCLHGETEPRTGGLRERNSLAVVEAGYRSMSEDGAVTVDRRETV